MHHLAPASLIARLGEPAAPVLDGAVERLSGLVLRVGARNVVLRNPLEDERGALSRRKRDLTCHAVPGERQRSNPPWRLTYSFVVCVVEVSVTEGQCSFVKEGRRLSPAIVHFCGDYLPAPCLPDRDRRADQRQALVSRQGVAGSPRSMPWTKRNGGLHGVSLVKPGYEPCLRLR